MTARPLAVSLVFALHALVATPKAGAEAGLTRVFKPGWEAQVEALLAPDGGETFAHAGWRADGLSVGPECRFALSLIHDGGLRLRVVVSPSAAPDEQGSFVAVAAAPPPGVDVEPVVQALHARLRANDPGDFFASACVAVLDDGERDREDPLHVARERTRRQRGGLLQRHAPRLLSALGFMLALWLSLIGWRRARRDALAAPAAVDAGAAPVSGRWIAAAVVGLTCLPRALLLDWLPVGQYEYEFFLYPREVLQTFTSGGAVETWFWYHAPLHPLILHAWNLIGDALGVGGQLGWLRAANLAPAAAASLLLLRVGALLGRRGVGLGAALLFALTPEIVLSSVEQHSYVWECAAALLVIERCAESWRSGRPVGPSLLIALGVSLWMGHLTLLTTAPALTALMIVTSDRARRRVLLWSLLAAAVVFLPIAARAAVGLMSYAGATVLSAETVDATLVEAQYAHLPIVIEAQTKASALSRFFMIHGVRLYGHVGAWMAAAGALLLVWRRWRLALVALGPIALFAAAATVLYLYNMNLGALLPSLLLTPLLGWREAARWGGPRVPRHLPTVAWLLVVLSTTSPLFRKAVWPRPLEDQGLADVAALPALHSLAASPPWAGRPIVLAVPPHQVGYELCVDRERVEGVAGCFEQRGRRDETSGTYSFEQAGRRLWAMKRRSCRAVMDLFDEAPWGTGPVLYLTRDFPIRGATSGARCEALRARLLTRCERWMTPNGLLVLGCQGAATGAGDAPGARLRGP